MPCFWIPRCQRHPAQTYESPPKLLSQLRCSDAAALDAVCRERGIPLILGRAYGLVGLVQVNRVKWPRAPDPSDAVLGLLVPMGCLERRSVALVTRNRLSTMLPAYPAWILMPMPGPAAHQVCVAEHCVVESKPDNTIEDLR